MSKRIHAPFSYISLQIMSDPKDLFDPDVLTLRSHLRAAMIQFLGVTGSAISLDILKVYQRQCWIRVPREDLSSVVAALGGWAGDTEHEGRVGWHVKSIGSWLSVLSARASSDDLWN